MTICPECGEAFETARNTQKYCTAQCRINSYKKRRQYPTQEPGEDMNEVRARMGLSPFQSGTVKCLKCDQQFESWDMKSNRICPRCKAYLVRPDREAWAVC